MSSVQAEEKEREESESEAVKELKQVEVKDDLPTRSGKIDTSRVDKPAVQEGVMPKEPSTAPATVKETPTEEDPAPQGKTVNDEAAEACETAAQPIEQVSKRFSNSVRGVGSELKVFISHCKRISGTEDKAIWIADVLDSSEVDIYGTQRIRPTSRLKTCDVVLTETIRRLHKPRHRRESTTNADKQQGPESPPRLSAS